MECCSGSGKQVPVGLPDRAVANSLEFKPAVAAAVVVVLPALADLPVGPLPVVSATTGLSPGAVPVFARICVRLI